MSIKYNEFGEVISVNGITTGQHLGAPMQDAIAEKDSDNKAYATQVNTVTRAENCVDDAQPTAGGGSGGSGGGGMVIDFDNLPDDKRAFWESIREAVEAGIPVDGYYSASGGLGRVRLTANRVNGGQIFFTGVEWKYDYMSEAYGNVVYMFGLTLNMSGIEKFESNTFTLNSY